MAMLVMVDDDPEVCAALKMNLQDAGHLVRSARNGREGLELLQRLVQKNTPPALVITDFSMPVMTGVDLILACRADPSLASIPFILCSGALEVRESANLLGVPFYSKFDRHKSLVAKIDEILNQRSERT